MPRARLLHAALRPLRTLLASDSAAGVLLILVAAAAIAVANSPLYGAYEALLHNELFPRERFKLNTVHLWINDALMVVFFFVVGLEIKREIVAGNLADPRQRNLPVMAAAGGMAAPAIVFLSLAGGDPALTAGWAIPAATDIAFAMGVVGLLGNRVPASLRLFLLTVAIVDDLGAVIIIALFYTAGLKLAWLLGALVVVAGLIALNRSGTSRKLPFVAGAVVLWFCVLNSGVHATIAGVLAALTIPIAARDGSPMLEEMEHGLAGWNAFLVVPVFGFANAGVSLAGMGAEALLAPLPVAIAAGLVIGKQVGIFGSVYAAERLGIARRPAGASWAQVWGVSMLCGIGFTMSLFISQLAFPEYRHLVDAAKIGILGGSLVSALLGYAVLRLAARPA